ncbi:MAG: ribonuclease HII [Fibrobacter sp.]|nr:ribonuclease HII [Fibrobacter sp.]
MKFKLPSFLEGVEAPVDGEVAVRRYAAENLGAGGSGIAPLVVGIDEVGRGPLAGPVVACAAVLKAPDALLTLNDSKKLTRPKREAMFESVKEACACYAIASASVKEIDEMNILEADFLAMRRALQALGMPGIEESAPEIPIEVKGSFTDALGTPLSSLGLPRPDGLAMTPEGSARLTSDGLAMTPEEASSLTTNHQPQTTLIAVDGNLKIRGVPSDCQLAVIKGDGRVASISAASILAKVFRDRYMDKLAETYPAYGFERNAGYGSKAHLDAIRKFGLTPEHRRSFHPKSIQLELPL